MMPPDAVDSAAGALIAKQVLREIARSRVKTALDEHYFAVMLHKGVSRNLKHLTFVDISKLLGRPTASVHRMIADHMVNGSARGGCKLCNGASKELRALVVDDEIRMRNDDPFSLFIMLSSFESTKRRRARGPTRLVDILRT